MTEDLFLCFMTESGDKSDEESHQSILAGPDRSVLSRIIKIEIVQLDIPQLQL